MRKIKQLFTFCLLLALAASLFAAGAKEAADDEILVKVLSVTAQEDGSLSFETRTENGDVVVYHTSADTETSYELENILAGDFLMVTDNGMMTMSLPAQTTAKSIRYVTPLVKNGTITADFSAPASLPGLAIGFGSPDESDIYSLFSYSYGYLSMKGLTSQGIYPDGGYFARAVIDAADFTLASPLMELEDMNAAIDEYVAEFLEKNVPTTYGKVLTELEDVLSLTEPEDIESRFAYGYGYLSTLNLLYNGVDIYPEEFAAGILAALYSAAVPYTEAELNGFIQDYVDQLENEYQAYIDELAESNLAAAEAYLEDNARREDVIILPTGVQVEFMYIEDEDATVKPLSTDTVTVSYRLVLMDGTVMDQGTNVQFSLSNLIPGFRDAVLLMSPGDIVVAVVPPDQGYGANGAGNIEPNSLLIFEISLISIDRD